jgi:hypothetical protein
MSSAFALHVEHGVDSFGVERPATTTVPGCR